MDAPWPQSPIGGTLGVMTSTPERPVPPVVLAIAGSEASGGAGAQTDLKTFHQLGVFGCTALTCIVSMDPKAGFDHRFVPVDQVESEAGGADVEALMLL